MNLGEALLQLCESRGEDTALVTMAGRSVSFAEFRERALATAARLRVRRFPAGGKVGVCAPVSAELFAGVVGSWAVGAVPVFPESSRGLGTVLQTLDEAELGAILMPWRLGWTRMAQPGLFSVPRLGLGGRERRVPTCVAREPGDPAMISYSSGTTGKPKVIVRSHGVLAAQGKAILESLEGQAGERLFTTMPGFVLAALANGQTCILGRRLPATPEFLAKRGVNRLLGAPAFYRKLVSHPDLRPLSVSRIDVGGALVSWELLESLTLRFPGAQVVSVYGATEAEPIACQPFREASPQDRQAFARGEGMLVGRPVAGLTTRIEPVANLAVGGELCVAGDAVVANSEDGYRTGDLVRLDDQGRLWLLGRRSAAWLGPEGLVPPLAVEGLALTAPGVAQAALVGHRGCLVVQASPDAFRRVVANLRQWSQFRTLRVLRYKVPVEKRHRSKPDMPRLDQIVKRELDHAVTIKGS